MHAMRRVMLAQAAGGGGGGGTGIIQTGPYLRTGAGTGTVSLSSTPTVGNNLLVLMSGFVNCAEPPATAGWTTLIYGKENNGLPTAQKMWAAVKPVLTGETGSVTLTGATSADGLNAAIYEIGTYTNVSAALGTASQSGSTWNFPYAAPGFTATMRFAMIEHDWADALSWDAGQGLTGTHDFNGGGYGHSGTLAIVPNAFSGTLTGISASGIRWPGYMTLSFG